MYAPKYRLEAIETIGRKILLEYDRTLLEGPPQAIPVETIIETKFNLTLEYHTLRKNGSVLGETIFDDGAAILYDRTERQYRLIAVKAGTILMPPTVSRLIPDEKPTQSLLPSDFASVILGTVAGMLKNE